MYASKLSCSCFNRRRSTLPIPGDLPSFWLPADLHYVQNACSPTIQQSVTRRKPPRTTRDASSQLRVRDCLTFAIPSRCDRGPPSLDRLNSPCHMTSSTPCLHAHVALPRFVAVPSSPLFAEPRLSSLSCVIVVTFVRPWLALHLESYIRTLL